MYMSLKKTQSQQRFFQNRKIMKRDSHKIRNWNFGVCEQIPQILYNPSYYRIMKSLRHSTRAIVTDLRRTYLVDNVKFYRSTEYSKY